MMTSRVSSPVWTVGSPWDEAVHLRLYGHDPGEPRTMCGTAPGRSQAATAFYQAGCISCAARAMADGVLFIADRQAFISLPRFLRRQPGPAHLPAIPESRSPQTAH